MTPKRKRTWGLQSLQNIELKVRTEDGHWAPVYLSLEENDHGEKLLLFKSAEGFQVVESLSMQITAYVFETTLSPNAFALVLPNLILYISAPTQSLARSWVLKLREIIAECGELARDEIFYDALERQSVQSYVVTFQQKRPLGIVFERTQEWVYIKWSDNASLEDGSILSEINGIHSIGLISFSLIFIILLLGKSVLLSSYAETQELLGNWQPPLKLSFIRPPKMQGFLLQLTADEKWMANGVVLEGGKLHMCNNQPQMEHEETAYLLGMTVGLVPADVYNKDYCFQIQYGFKSAVFQAANYHTMMDWACALYYGIAIANGGGYVLALERLAKKAGQSFKEFSASILTKNRAAQMEKYMEGSRELTPQGSSAESTPYLYEFDLDGDLESMISLTPSRNFSDAEAFVHEDGFLCDHIDNENDAFDAESTIIIKEDVVQEERDLLTVDQLPQPSIANASEMCAYDRAIMEFNLRKIFRDCAKFDGRNVGYINVMQFSSIWRIATGVKGNLFNEMKIFNTRFTSKLWW